MAREIEDLRRSQRDHAEDDVRDHGLFTESVKEVKAEVTGVRNTIWGAVLAVVATVLGGLTLQYLVQTSQITGHSDQVAGHNGSRIDKLVSVVNAQTEAIVATSKRLDEIEAQDGRKRH
jgi:hypothetical protein